MNDKHIALVGALVYTSDKKYWKDNVKITSLETGEITDIEKIFDDLVYELERLEKYESEEITGTA